jgi:peptidoglycan/LPS O-acetylase OafA/YrhL
MPRFYFQRATRIWIPYAAALALALPLSLWRDRLTPKYFELLFYKATFVYNFFGTPQLASHIDAMPLHGALNHLWSICVEEQFYLFAPLLLVMWSARFGRSLLVWCGVTLLIALAHSKPAIPLGVCAALVHHRCGPVHRNRWVILGVVLVAAVSAYGLATDALSYDTAAAPLAMAIVLLFAIKGPKQRIASYLGAISYPLYLNHWLGLFCAHAIAKRIGVGHGAALALDIVFGLAVAAVMYELVDRKVLQRRAGWFTVAIGRRVTIVAYAMVVIGCTGAAIIQLAQKRPEFVWPIVVWAPLACWVLYVARGVWTKRFPGIGLATE